MTFPWESMPVSEAKLEAVLPWPVAARNPAFIKDPVTGLWPGQQHPTGIPNFLKRGHPDCVIKDTPK
jgi:hypothetical protein